MRVKLIAAGTKMPKWVAEGYGEYSKRLRQELRLELIEVPIAKRSKNADSQSNVETLLLKEEKSLLQHHAKDDLLVALDMKGKQLSTEELAHQIGQWQQSGSDISLLVGGPDGLSSNCIQSADFAWSLSPLTLPHPMVRVLVAEQLYRAWSITKGHPYHK